MKPETLKSRYGASHLPFREQDLMSEADVKKALTAIAPRKGSNLTDEQERNLRSAFEYALLALRHQDCDLALQVMQDSLSKEPLCAATLTVGESASAGVQRTVGALMDHWRTPVAPVKV